MTTPRMNIFHSASLRLTLWYLLIIMVLSTLFSIVLYRVSTQEFSQEARRLESLQESPLFVPRGFNEFRRVRLAQIAESKQRIQVNLVYFNFIILIAGGAASYFLAKRTLEPIQEVLEAQHRFTADASHELRTPLTAMRTEIEVALRDKKLSLEEAKQLLKSNLEEVSKLQSLSAGLLKLAQSDTTTYTAFEPCKLQSITQEAIERVTPLAKAKHITIETNAANITIDGDARSLTELLVILLDNAIKYSDENKTVSVTLSKKANQAVLTIRDEGIGIPAADLPHVFNRFYRADVSRSKHRAEGYGLGLSIAQKIVASHNGTITVKSTMGKGSTFTITLPLTQ